MDQNKYMCSKMRKSWLRDPLGFLRLSGTFLHYASDMAFTGTSSQHLNLSVTHIGSEKSSKWFGSLSTHVWSKFNFDITYAELLLYYMWKLFSAILHLTAFLSRQIPKWSEGFVAMVSPADSFIIQNLSTSLPMGIAGLCSFNLSA